MLLDRDECCLSKVVNIMYGEVKMLSESPPSSAIEPLKVSRHEFNVPSVQ
jgi:hypothetical protein